LTHTGQNFNTALANTLLADDFTDLSDSINFMANITLQTVTFPSKQAFIYGQGSQAPVQKVQTLNIWHDCHSITWRWFLLPGVGANVPVAGINYMVMNEKKQIQTNYAEFNNAAWLLSYGNPQCKAAAAAATTNGTSSA